jgi:hypothetical protein
MPIGWPPLWIWVSPNSHLSDSRGHSKIFHCLKLPLDLNLIALWFNQDKYVKKNDVLTV